MKIAGIPWRLLSRTLIIIYFIMRPGHVNGCSFVMLQFTGER